MDSLNSQFGCGENFSASEVRNLFGRRVSSGRGTFVSPGTEGAIADGRATPIGWLITVNWENGSSDHFTKREANKSLSLLPH